MRYDAMRSVTAFLMSARGVIVASAALFGLSASVTGQTNSRDTTPVNHTEVISPRIEALQTKVANGMAPIDVLVIEDQIRQKWADYTLLLDGDGVSNQSAEWANHLFTKDLKWRWYDADGKLRLALNSRDEEQKPARAGRPQPSAKHLPITIKFDEIAPDEVKTRSVVVLFNVPASKAEGQPDGVPYAGVAGIPTANMVVYHDTWRREDGEWKKAVTILYSANYGGQVRSTESCPIPPGTAPGCAPVLDGAAK
jgi:hypothetical protein